MSESGDEVVPLPHCVGSEAVDEEKRRPGFFVGLGGPTVHDGAVAEIGGGGLEACIGEGVAVAPVTRSSEAETPCHVVCVCFFFFFG